MAGHGGKTYEIWTIEEANKFADALLVYAQINEECYTLGMAAIECGEYEAVIPYLENKFDIEFNPIKKAREIIKNRCLRLGMNGKTNPTMTIFNLVNNFDMLNTNAKQQVTAKIDGNITDIDYSKLSESALKEISALKSSEGPSGAV